MKLTGKEKFHIQFLVPVQGSLKTLELAEGILKRINIQPEDAEDGFIYDIDLKIEEISFLQEMIKILDKSQKLHLQSLPVVRKILNYKE
jgi:hypothetical protein